MGRLMMTKFERRSACAPQTSLEDAVTDEFNPFQIYRDLSFCERNGSEIDVVVEGMDKLIQRSKPESTESNTNGSINGGTPVPESAEPQKIGELWSLSVS